MTNAASSALEKWSKVRFFVKEASGINAFSRIRIGLLDDRCKVTKKLTAIIQQLGIKVSHKAGDASVPVSKQGNPMLYTEEYLQERADLHEDPRVQQAIRRIWNIDVSINHS